MRTVNTKNRAARFFLSFFAATVLAFAPAAEPQLWTLVITFILLVFYARYILRVKTFSFPGFFPAFAVFTALQLYINERLNAAVGFNFFAVSDISANLYYLAISTWGIGILGVCLCVCAFVQKDSPLKMFAFFALVYNAFMVSIDSASPFLVLFAFCYIFIHGLDFKRTVFAALALGIIFVIYNTSSSLADVSKVFCVIALLFVLVGCAERYRGHIITLSLLLVFLYSGVYLAVIALPAEAERAERENTAAHTVSEFIYNSADAPPTYIINNSELAPVLRFLNRNTVIETAADFNELPEDCFIISAFSRYANFDIFNYINDSDDMVILAVTADHLIFTAKGERAEAFAISQE
jgi:hypothetical protein